MAWYLKKNDGAVYGPVELETLQLWATDGRVAPDDQLSETRETWIPAPDVPELGMDWMVELRDRTMFGPLHLLAIRDLLLDGSVSPRGKVSHKKTEEVRPVTEALVAVLMEQCSRLSVHAEAVLGRAEEAEARCAALQNELADAKRESGAKAPARNGNGPAPSDPWKKLFEDEKAAARGREEKLREQLKGLESAAAERDRLRSEVERLKKAAAAAPAAPLPKREPHPAEEATGDMVPRARLEEAELKLAQMERAYQTLLKNRTPLPAQRQTPSRIKSPDNMRRRDVS